ATANLMDLVGPARTKDILVTGRLVSAEEALQIGLANRVVPHDELMPKVEEFVQDIIKQDRKIVMRTVNLVDMMTGQDHAEASDLEAMYTDEWLRELEEND
ncbi:MAG: enoyl-CoA hydratase-related protein, partial [Candidatus Thorarchaeota archaeon]